VPDPSAESGRWMRSIFSVAADGDAGDLKAGCADREAHVG
jgi:hypothetical protein